MPAWPGTLPQYVGLDSFNEQKLDGSVRTPMEAGNMKTRRRFTAVPRQFKVVVHLSLAQKAYLDEFYGDTLSEGSLTFEWVLPAEQTACVFMFKAPPAYSAEGPSHFIAALELQTVI